MRAARKKDGRRGRREVKETSRVYPTLYDWSKVDWTLQDTSIARLMGCSREAVRVRRSKLGMPPAPTQGKRTVIKEVPTIAKAKDLGIDPTKYTSKELADILGVCSYTAAKNFPDRKRTHGPYDWSCITRENCSRYGDDLLAKKVGCHEAAFRNKRISLGILRKRGRHDTGTHPLIVEGKGELASTTHD